VAFLEFFAEYPKQYVLFPLDHEMGEGGEQNPGDEKHSVSAPQDRQRGEGEDPGGKGCLYIPETDGSCQ